MIPRAAVACTAPATARAGCPTATFEFLGRIDFQVKIRGYRIELGRDRGRALGSTRPCARRSCWRATDGRAGDVWSPTWCRSAPRPAETDAPALAGSERHLPDYMVPARAVVPRRLAAAPERQDRPQGGAAPRGASRCASRSPRARSRSCVAALFAGRARASRLRRAARRLLRARRALALGHAPVRAAEGDAAGRRCRCGSLFERRTPAGLAAELDARAGRGARACSAWRRSCSPSGCSRAASSALLA